MSKDCLDCGNSRLDVYGRSIPVIHHICLKCRGDRFDPKPMVSQWYPRGLIRVEDEFEIGPAEYVGQMPIREEVTVIPRGCIGVIREMAESGA